MTAMGEHYVSLLGDADAAQLAGKSGKARDFNAGDILEVAGAVAVAGHAIGRSADLSGNVADIRSETLPLGGNALVRLEGVALAEPRDQQGPAVVETWRLEFHGEGLVHDDRLHELVVVDAAPGAHGFRCQAELI